MHYVYVLRLGISEWYIGYTKDLKRRFQEHQNKYTGELIYYESYQSEKLARDRERKLKYYGSAWRALKKRIFT